MALKFEYKRYRVSDGPDLTRPIIRVLLNNPRYPSSASSAYEALVGSGADFCVLPVEISELLHIDLSAVKSATREGSSPARGGRSIFHALEIQVGAHGQQVRIPIWAGFMPELADNGHGILGRHGVFSSLSFVKFRDFDYELQIGRRRQ